MYVFFICFFVLCINNICTLINVIFCMIYLLIHLYNYLSFIVFCHFYYYLHHLLITNYPLSLKHGPLQNTTSSTCGTVQDIAQWLIFTCLVFGVCYKGLPCIQSFIKKVTRVCFINLPTPYVYIFYIFFCSLHK